MVKKVQGCLIRKICLTALALMASLLSQRPVCANPTYTTATIPQGAASFNVSGSHLTINAANNTFINWQGFNIGAGETTTFVQPTSSSLVWNQINDPNPSQILGNLNANGYVVLQNQSGFYIGGQAAISAHGLIMTTTPTPMPNFSSGGAWTFDAPPPSANIINYGKINITGGGSAFLIASDIENRSGIDNQNNNSVGSISAPGGTIGLYAGEKVLVSSSPDGRGLSAVATVPQGVVNNQGQLIANAGSIVLNAQTVNQGGLIQANSVQNINGTIELLASDNINLGANSVLSAHGDATGTSSGGTVDIKSGNHFSDQAGSSINISGGAQGGNGGQVEISALQMSAINTSINGQAVDGFISGELTVDPLNIQLVSSGDNGTAVEYSSGTVNSSDPPAAGTLILNVNSFASTLSQINLQAVNNIELSTFWSLTDPGVPATLTLTAGNNITFDDGTAIIGGNNWSVNLTAGTSLTGSATTSGSDGIYLNGSSFLQTANGNIKLTAANEVQVGWMGTETGAINSGLGSISTTAGGNIDVSAKYGSVNTGSGNNGFVYTQPNRRHPIVSPPYYTVSSGLGGISTADGGNVTINAGGNVISYNPDSTKGPVGNDAGTGAYGSQPGNVTINAGGNVYGHYVLANGVGTITAGNDVGVPSGGNSVALSLIDGTWNVNAPNGNIYLQEVRNPNGVFNNANNDTANSAHLFDYAPDASVNLDAGIGVDLTDVNLPRLSSVDEVQVIYPPILNIIAGSGGVTLQDNVTLFPSADQNLTITTTAGGNLQSKPNNPGATPQLLMSDSSQTRWIENVSIDDITFGAKDHGTGVPVQAASSDKSVLTISGSMENLTLITSKETQIKVDGNMIGCGFSGQNLHASDVTSITVLGQIYNQSPYSFVYGVNIPAIPTTDLLPGMASVWYDIFTLALDPTIIKNLTVPVGTLPSQLASYAIQSAALFPVSKLPSGQLLGVNPGFFYNQATGQLGFSGPMSQSVLSALGSGQITILRLVNGQPVLDSKGHFLTDTITWAPQSDVQTLSYDSTHNIIGQESDAPLPGSAGELGYRIGGPGQFNIDAGSIELGNTYGILSCDVIDPQGGKNRYANLVSLTPSGASINVTVAGDHTVTVNGVTTTTPSLDMLTSTIATIGGGDVNVTSTGGSMDLGSQELLTSERQVGFGIYTAGAGNVNITASGDVNIDGSRIAAFDGGNISVESLQGTVNVGSGGATVNGVSVSYVNSSGQAELYTEAVSGSGILASTLVDPSQVGGATLPGNITVSAPQGDIVASQGGILQEALNGNVTGGPTITLTAGTFPSGTPGSPGYSPGHVGNIDLGDSGVIGGTISLSANGNISGVVISRQSSTINAAQNFTGTLLSAGSADVSAGGSVSGTIIGVGGASVSGGSISASVLGQNVSVNGGAAQSTLGSSATATSTSQAASQQAAQTTSQQVASTTDTGDDKNKKKPVLERTKRVTVILPKSS